MTERIDSTDAPPPPPPPAETEAKEPIPDVSPELSDALPSESQDSGAWQSGPESADAAPGTAAQEAPPSQEAEPPRDGVDSELRSAIADPAPPDEAVSEGPDPEQPAAGDQQADAGSDSGPAGLDDAMQKSLQEFRDWQSDGGHVDRGLDLGIPGANTADEVANQRQAQEEGLGR